MIISQVNIGERLDRWLTEQLPQLSRAKIQELIEAHTILVNQKPAIKHYALKTGDVVFVPDVLPVTTKFILQPSVLPQNVTLGIIAETPDYIIVNKPAGVQVHPGPTHLQNDTLINYVLQRYPEIQTIGEDPFRPGIVHRLDRDVSGIMVIARSQEMFQWLKLQFKQHLVYKRYLALAHGVFTELHDNIKLAITRSTGRHGKMAARSDNEGKEAHTEYDVVEQFQNYALLSVIIHTGRTHQIRVHLNAISHPVVGETIYVPKHFHSRLQPGRLFLHATELGFNLLNGEAVKYEVPLPEQLQAILDTLR